MEILVLGSGTSHGVPMIGCECAVCHSDNPRNKRYRASILVQAPEGNILVDTTPELRVQSLANGVRRVDAVLFTHTHADHIMGFDDLRRFSDLSDRDIPVYGDEGILTDIRRIYDYVFRETQAPGGKPRVRLQPVAPEFDLLGLHVRSFYVMHGRLPVLAYRFDQSAQEGRAAVSVAYLTDVNQIPPTAMSQLSDLDVLFLDAVRFDPHPSHFGLYEALEVIANLKPRRAYLTHLSHHFDHDAVNAQLPPSVELAYDGLRVTL